MPSIEQFYQQRPLEIAPTNHGELGTQPLTSPRMEQVVTQLAAAYHVDLLQPGANFNLDWLDKSQRWMIANLDGTRIGVTRCQVEEENLLRPDLDMVFAVSEFGWEPREIVYADSPWNEFTQAAKEHELTVFDAQDDLRYDVFTEFFAQQIERAGWLVEGLAVWEATGAIPPLSGGTPEQLVGARKQETDDKVLNGPAEAVGKKRNDYFRVLDLGLNRNEDLSPAANWLLEMMLCYGEGDLQFLEQYAKEQGISFQVAYNELDGYGLIVRSKPGWIDLPYQIIPSSSET